jgi:hypothetical protein
VHGNALGAFEKAVLREVIADLLRICYMSPVGLSAEVNFLEYYTKPGFNLTSKMHECGSAFSGAEVTAWQRLSDAEGVRPRRPAAARWFSGGETEGKNHGF